MNWFTRSTISRNVPIGEITPNPQQPRVVFEKQALAELASSMSATGLIQPIVVRPTSHNSFVIVDGERRWRAAQLLGWSEIMAVIKPREGDDRDDAVEAIVANLHRRDLNPIEFAVAIQRLREQLQGDNQEVGRLLGLNPSVISNKIRLLRLWPAAQDALRDGKISERQAAALLPLCDLPEGVKFSTETVLTRAMSGISSNQLRNEVDTIIHNATWSLTDGMVNFDWKTECTNCPLLVTIKREPRCGDRGCRTNKQMEWEADYLSRASAATGIPFVSNEQRSRPEFRLQMIDIKMPELTGLCENLRLRVGVWGTPVPGFPEARLACSLTGTCACQKAQSRAAAPPRPDHAEVVNEKTVMRRALLNYRAFARKIEQEILDRLIDQNGDDNE